MWGIHFVKPHDKGKDFWKSGRPHMKLSPKEYLAHYKVRHKYANVNGRQTHWVEYGKGMPLVGLHGLGGAWTDYWSLLPAIKRRRAYLLDLPGCGKTESLPKNSIKATADWLESWLTMLRLKDITIEAICTSAPIALEYSKRNPDNVKALILHMPVLNGNWVDRKIRMLYIVLTKLPSPIHHWMHKSSWFINHIILRDEEHAIPESAILDAENKKSADIRVFTAYFPDVLIKDYLEVYRNFKEKTLVLAMQQDSMLPAEKLKMNSSGKKLIIFKNAHSWNKDVIRRQNREIEKFLA